MVMVLTIAALDTAGKVDNWILVRADLRLRSPAESAVCFPRNVGVCVRIWAGADGGDDDDGDGDDGDGDGVGDGDHSTRRT